MRQNELLNLEGTDIIWEENTVLVKHAKTYCMRKVPINEETKSVLKLWLNVRGEAYTNQLFCSISGEILTQRGLYQMISRYGRKAKVENVRVSPHTFRHMCQVVFNKGWGFIFITTYLQTY